MRSRDDKMATIRPLRDNNFRLKSARKRRENVAKKSNTQKNFVIAERSGENGEKKSKASEAVSQTLERRAFWDDELNKHCRK